MSFEKKSFGSRDGGGNFDDAPTSDDFKPNQWVNMENCRVLTTDAGETGNVETIGSTTLFPNPYLPAGTNIEIGSAIDEANNRILSANWNSNGDHAIYCWDVINDIVYIVLLDAQVVTGLNFDKDHLIHSSRVINGSWYITDFFNEPRRVNIEAGILLNDPSYVSSETPYVAPLNEAVIALIRRQPGLPPVPVKIFQTSPPYVNNFIINNAYRFSYEYTYMGFEQSTLSAQSILINYNFPTDQFNRIDVTIPLGEVIDQDVLWIDLVAYYVNTNTAFIINTWDKRIPADAAAIAAHNAGTQALVYSFYDDKQGIAVDPTYFNKPFDSVPLLCEGLETAKNRLLLANYLLGYGTPITTSLAAVSITNQAGVNVTGEWYLLKFTSLRPPTSPAFYSVYVLVVYNIGLPGLTGLYVDNFITVPPFPGSVDYTQLIYVAGSPPDAMEYFAPGQANTMTGFTDQGSSSILNNAPAAGGLNGTTAFKSAAYYQLGISFLDNSGRKTPILTNDSLKILTPDRIYLQVTYTTGIGWTLSQANALQEIPIEAYYYSINITKCLRTRFFEQMRGANASYATQDTAIPPNYVFTTSTFAATLVGCAFDISSLYPYQMGYIFTEGDIIKIYLAVPAVPGAPTEFNLRIIAQVGNWLVTELQNLGTLDSTIKYVFEIYTPYKQSTNEAYFEIGQLFKITNPGTAGRMYSVIAGQITGDITLVDRNDGTQDYLVEAMSPNDKFYQMWNTNAGRSNVVSSLGQVNRKSSGCFSNTFIPGTEDNGLSTFDALDVFDVYPECGAIRKIQLTSKVSGQQGGVMLAICEEEIVSIYLGESQLLASAANADIAISTGVIGSMNVLKGGFGTINPEGVYEFRGNIFIPDVRNGKIIQYSTNGLFPISSYKMTRFWKLFCDQYVSMTSTQIEALGSRPFIFMAVDPHNWELLITIPKLLNTPPKGYLPDYPNMIYPFDIWDGQAKTIVYKLIADPNNWTGAYSHTPEGMIVINNNVYGFKNGNMYQHNSTTDYTINIYGVIYKGRIMFPSGQLKNKPKIYNNVSVEGNYKPSLTYFRTEPSLAEYDQYDLVEQASDLLDFDFSVKEGQLYSVIYRNKLVPTAEGLSLNGLLTAEKIRALILKVLLEFTPTTQPLELRFVTLGSEISTGHTT